MTGPPEERVTEPIRTQARQRAASDRRAAELAQRLGWLIGIRLIVITSVVLPYFLLRLFTEASRERSLETFDFLYAIAGVTYLASLVYIGLLRLLQGREKGQAYIQFTGDVLLITALVYYFGGVNSPFSILYLITIILASILLERRAGIVVATLAWGFYAITSLALSFGWAAPPLDLIEGALVRSTWRLAYQLGIHLFGFYAVAVLTSRLAQSATKAQRELREKRVDLADLQEAYRDVIESIPSGLITTDLDRVVTSVNLAAQDILGRLRSDLLGRSIAETGLFSHEMWDDLTAERGLAAARERREVEYRRDEQTLRIGFAISPLTNAEGADSGHILIFQDLSDWRKLQEEVRMKDRMAAVGELASGLAHEIGNPLAAISGSVQMLSSSFEGESAQEKLLDILAKESERLDRTIKGFLKFARPRERVAVEFDVAEQLAENVELLRNSSEVLEGHQVTVDVDPPSVVIVGDPDQISQIFWNLTRNALRAMPGGGELRVEGRLEGDHYHVAFSDTGHGMSEEERANLFHPFHSLFDGGTGIGMAIVYRIVHDHGGRLTVESEVGKGTEIVVDLPTTVTAQEPLSVGAS